MVTIHGKLETEITAPVQIQLTLRQIADLEEEMEDYNNHYNPKEPFTNIGDYIVFILEVLEREIG